MELVLKSLDLLLSKILLPGTDPQAFRRRFRVSAMNIKYNIQPKQSIALRNPYSMINIYFVVTASVAIDPSLLFQIILGFRVCPLLLLVYFPKLV